MFQFTEEGSPTTMRESAQIRSAGMSDAEAITRLLIELDCDVGSPDVAARLAWLVDRPSDRVFVADVDGEVIGLLGMHLAPLLHRDSFARITAFIVTEAHRGRGYGEALLREAETWAFDNGCSQIELNSGDHHLLAHGFYERMGYREYDRRFVKERRLGGDPLSPV